MNVKAQVQSDVAMATATAAQDGSMFMKHTDMPMYTCRGTPTLQTPGRRQSSYSHVICPDSAPGKAKGRSLKPLHHSNPIYVIYNARVFPNTVVMKLSSHYSCFWDLNEETLTCH